MTRDAYIKDRRPGQGSGAAAVGIRASRSPYQLGPLIRLPRGRRPGRPLILLRHRFQAFVGELPDALSFVGLCRVDVAPRIGRDVEDAMPLTWLAAALAERRQDVERVAGEFPMCHRHHE